MGFFSYLCPQKQITAYEKTDYFPDCINHNAEYPCC